MENNAYRVANIVGAGRGLIATRDIKAGELILKASPAGLGRFSLNEFIVHYITTFGFWCWLGLGFAGPQASAEGSQSQCVECWRNIRSPFPCPRCRLPCCDFNCSQGKLHRYRNRKLPFFDNEMMKSRSECDIFLQLRLKLQVSSGNGIFKLWADHEKDILASILPVRILSLKWR